MYMGWINRQVNGAGYNDTWIGRVTVGKDGKPLPEPRVWRSHTAGEVIDSIETFLDRKIVLEETVNSEVGYRIK